MHETLRDIPDRIDAERLYLRPYEASDGSWYYAMGQRNRDHLARYETDNAARSLRSVEDAEELVEELAAAWEAQKAFFLGAFDRETDRFLAQVTVVPVDWDVPEFAIGFFVDVEHEGQGFVTESVREVMGFVFQHLAAHRVRMECDDTNVRSQRVAERCGLLLEGHIRENKRNPDGTLSGTLHFGLLGREFKALDQPRGS
ncbi:MAG: GNAT family N-acetyltransferase [Anaerolineae bacterium]|jgi:aminoglycoside 6'-N-acetyltransferase